MFPRRRERRLDLDQGELGTIQGHMRLAIELEVGEPHAAHALQVSALGERRIVVERSLEGHVVILVDAVAADAQPADELARPAGVYVLVESRAAREEDDSVLVLLVERVMEVRVGIEGIKAL